MILHVVLILVGAGLGGWMVCLMTAARESDLRIQIERERAVLAEIGKRIWRWHGMVTDPNCREYSRRELEHGTLDNIYALLCRAGSEEKKP